MRSKAGLAWIIVLVFIGCLPAFAQSGKIGSMKAVESGFVSIPDSIQTSVYWYWMSDNISEQGVINDLEAMKKVGINRAFIGNIGGQGVPYGKVKIFTPEWWNIMHAALKAATRLNIEIGIFNSPGWSQSGGPWVKSTQAMRYLTSSQITVQGPLMVNQILAKPEKDFQNVRVIAYPCSLDTNILTQQHQNNELDAKLSSIPVVSNLNDLIDNNEGTGVKLEKGKQFTLNITLAEERTIRSMVLYPQHTVMHLKGNIQVKQNGQYVTLKEFNIDHSRPALNVGFKPYGPAAISIPQTIAKELRIVFTDILSDGAISEIKLSATPVVEDYIGKTLAKMYQQPLPYWNEYQWPAQPVVTDARQVIDPAKVIDISKYMAADGTLKWEAPAGSWVIERCGMTPTGVQNGPASPEGTGPEIDKMSHKLIEYHFNAFLGEILKRIPPEDRKTWKVTVEDSYEMGGQNWTDQMIEKFRARYGYDPTPYLPVMQGRVVGSEDLSDRFLWDLRRFVADNVAYEYVAGLREISHSNGLHTWLESYGHWGFPGEFLQYGGQSDEVAGEFWSFGELGNIENRDASSTAHIYGKTKVSAESFTGADSAFSRYPAMLKQRVDRFFTEGINNTLLHLYIEQPYEDKYPGVNAKFGNEFNRHNTWFYDMDIFLQYIKRCNLMLQQGKYVADVAYFIGEDAPKMTGVRSPELPAGYSFDYMNAEIIKTRMSVRNGKLVLPDGMQYSILVLPKLQTMRPELLLKIKQLVMEGAVVLGPRPSRSPSMENYGMADKQVQQLAAGMWGNIDGATVKVNHLGKGTIIDGMDLSEALNMIKARPDFKATLLSSSKAKMVTNLASDALVKPIDSILFIHRTLADGDIYFISNQKNSPVKFDGEFKIIGKRPELWNAITDTRRELPSFKQKNFTIIPMQLGPLESTFVVFRKNDKTSHEWSLEANYPLPILTSDITGTWSVTFDQHMRGPARTVKFETLTDWIKNTNDSIKYYSGTAFYNNTFIAPTLKARQKVMLDLGAISAIAKVRVNGIEAGGAWIAPYKVDITKVLKPGLNKLEVKIVNTWVNRLIGDQNLPESQRKTWLYTNPYRPNSTLLPSGLLGPVKIEIYAR